MNKPFHFMKIPKEFDFLDDAISYVNKNNIQHLVFQFVFCQKYNNSNFPDNYTVVILGFNDYEQYVHCAKKINIEEPISIEKFYNWN